ncbi:hypothetical protein RE2895_53850 [Rhodococcus erythropolis]|nr:hypothetical protein RE2895_53850 [Rhodococcus erythropolis]
MRSIGQYGGTHYGNEFEYPTDEPAKDSPHCADARGCHYKIHARGLCRKHWLAHRKARKEDEES